MASALALHLACAPLASLAIARTPSSTPPQFATARHATLVASRPASARDLPRRRYQCSEADSARTPLHSDSESTWRGQRGCFRTSPSDRATHTVRRTLPVHSPLTCPDKYRVGIARAANDGAPAVTSVSVGEARELVAAGHTYLDVRTPEEFRAAHVEGAVNIPFMLKSPSGMVKNDAFVADVKAQFDEDTPLVVACQGGVRSIRAAAELQNAGFSGITDMLGGFAAWQQKGFPSVF